MFGGYSESKLKPQLKMAVHRFQIASNKKSALLQQSMREIAVLLAENPPKEEKARIKAEALIRDDYMIEAYGILSLTCDLLSERLKLISFSKECPPDLVSSVATLLYATPRVDIPELGEIRKQFRAKYGKKFEEDAMCNVGGVLNERVISKLSIHPPAAGLVQTYLQTCCTKFEVKWDPLIPMDAGEMIQPMPPPIGTDVPLAPGTGLGPAITARTGVSMGSLRPAPEPFPSPEEPTIYIPPTPKLRPPTSSAPFDPSLSQAKPSAPTASSVARDDEDDDDDEDEDEDDDPANDQGGQRKFSNQEPAAYEDLVARFADLKKMG